MVTKEFIIELVEDKMRGTEMFITHVNVGSENRITVEIEDMKPIAMHQCIDISRHIERTLNAKGVEVFELNVTSPGLSKPFVHYKQYIKNVGRNITITQKEGEKLEGELKAADEKGIVLQTTRKERIEGRKAKQTIIEDHTLAYSDIEKALVVISFK